MSKGKLFLETGFLILVAGLTVSALFRNGGPSVFIRSMEAVSIAYAAAAIGLLMACILIESVIIKIIMLALDEKISLGRCAAYSFAGFLFYCISPAGSAEQPVQLYYMHKDGINASKSVFALAAITITFKSALLVTGGLTFLLMPEMVTGNAQVLFLFTAGYVLTAPAVVAFSLMLFVPNTVEGAALIAAGVLSRIHMVKSCSDTSEKITRFMDSYRNTCRLCSHPGLLILMILAVTVIQRFCLMAVTAVSCVALAVSGRIVSALILLAFSGLCDAFDGRVARSKKDRTSSEVLFGIQLDSLCDVICFGFFPGIICFQLGLQHPFGIILIIFYCISAVARLAYYNVLELETDNDDASPSCYYGLPVTSIVVIFPLTYILSQWVPAHMELLTWELMLLITGTLFITNIRIPKPGLKHILVMTATVSALFMMISHIAGTRQLQEGNCMEEIYMTNSANSKERGFTGDDFTERDGSSCEDFQTRLVRRLYSRGCGRLILAVITRSWFSKAAGSFLDSSFSKILIKGFIARHNIDMDDYANTDYMSFNDFFTRKIKDSLRPVNMDRKTLVAPCDGRLTVSPITEHGSVTIKGHSYTMKELVRNDSLASAYAGGTMLIFRLTVSDYHRYHYPDSGIKSDNTHIPGVLHTVSPHAAAARRIYCENSREYFTLNSDNFGEILMMQVGALLVGRIFNKHSDTAVVRGLEAGWFEYGGSTVILCLKPGVAELDEKMLEAAADGEVPVRMGQAIGLGTLR